MKVEAVLPSNLSEIFEKSLSTSLENSQFQEQTQSLDMTKAFSLASLSADESDTDTQELDTKSNDSANNPVSPKKSNNTKDKVLAQNNLAEEEVEEPEETNSGLDTSSFGQFKFGNIGGDTEDQDLDEDPKSIEASSSDTGILSSLDSEDVFYDLADNLVNSLKINLEELPEEVYSFEEWNLENYNKFVSSVIEHEKEKQVLIAQQTAQEAFNYITSNMSDITRKLFEFEKNKPEEETIKDFARQLVFEADITSLNPNNRIEAHKILEEYYKSLGETAEDANERINNLKDIMAEARKVKPKLDSKVQEIALKKIEEQDYILAIDLELKKELSQRVNNIFKSQDLDGIPLTNEVKSFINAVLVEDEVPVNIRGKEITLSGAEALIRKHKYDPQNGDLKHLMKVLVYLQAPQLFEKHIVNQIKTKETERFIKEHKSSATNKAGRAELPKLKSPTKKLGMRFETN